jgi:cytochrome c oxidase assembly protein subunit 11
MADNHTKKNTRTGLAVLFVVALMAGLSYAAVPFYRIFCQITGFGGTTQVAGAAPDKVVDRIVRVRFSGNVSRGMPWRFAPQQQEIAVKLGQKAQISFNAENLSDRAIKGTAVYNVTPNKTGAYFRKIQCFCFTEQILKPHEKVAMPVIFFVDPAMARDPALDDVTDITLSYTFFNESGSGLDKKAEDSYNAPVESVKTETAKASASSVR